MAMTRALRPGTFPALKLPFLLFLHRPCTHTLNTGGPLRPSSLLSTAGPRSACSPHHPTSTLARPTEPLNFSANSLLAR